MATRPNGQTRRRTGVGFDRAFARRTTFRGGARRQSLTPDQAFDRAWAIEILERTMGRLREEYESSGRGPLFAALAPRLWKNGIANSPSPSPDQAELNSHAVSMAMNRLRHRLGLRLREEVTATIAEGADIDAELRLLIAALGTS